MKVKFSYKFVTHTGKEIIQDGEAVTLKQIAIDSLMYPNEKEMSALTGSDKVKRHDLGVKILNNSDNTELVAEEVSLLKQLIGQRYIPTVVAQAYALLDGKELPIYNN